LRSRLPAVAVTVAALGVLAGCGSSSDHSAATAGTASTPATATAGTDHAAHGGTTFKGGTISPRRTAPPLRLRDIDGRLVDIRDLRGHPVLVTFVYSSCPDVCPLIMSNLRRAREDAGPLGAQMRVIAVSVDPKGDTPARVRAFLKARRVDGFVDYLIGSRAQLEPVWSAWQIGQSVPKSDPELVEHSSLVYGVSASGDLATAYLIGVKPDAIVHDLPLLAGS
jgi:protein SCO1/2